MPSLSLHRTALANVANKQHALLSPAAARKRIASREQAKRRSARGASDSQASKEASSNALFIFGSSPMNSTGKCTAAVDRGEKPQSISKSKKRRVARQSDGIEKMEGKHASSAHGKLYVPISALVEDNSQAASPNMCPSAPNNTPAGAFTNAVGRKGQIKPTDLFVELFRHTSTLQPGRSRIEKTCSESENDSSVVEELQEAVVTNTHATKVLGKRLRENSDRSGAKAPSDNMFTSCTNGRRGESTDEGDFFSCSMQ